MKRKARSRLTPKQRKEFADMLAMGIPEDVIEELDANITRYVAEWKQKIVSMLKKCEPAPTRLTRLRETKRQRGAQ